MGLIGKLVRWLILYWVWETMAWTQEWRMSLNRPCDRRVDTRDALHSHRDGSERKLLPYHAGRTDNCIRPPSIVYLHSRRQQVKLSTNHYATSTIWPIMYSAETTIHPRENLTEPVICRHRFIFHTKSRERNSFAWTN